MIAASLQKQIFLPLQLIPHCLHLSAWLIAQYSWSCTPEDASAGYTVNKPEVKIKPVIKIEIFFFMLIG
jgi:hypothetical protein